MAKARRKDQYEVYRYDGSNEVLNRIYDEVVDGPLWIVNDWKGRKPIMAGSAEEALAIYRAKYATETNEEG